MLIIVVTPNWGGANIRTICINSKKSYFFRFYRRGVSCAFMDKGWRIREDNSNLLSHTTRGFA
jgi:hypothetical protein